MLRTERGWQPAAVDDAPVVLQLMRDFYQEEKLPWRETVLPRAVEQLLADASLGRIFLLRDDARVQGYVVATVCFSLEFGGRYLLLDELYLAPAARGRGDAKGAFACVDAWALSQGISAVRLEVNHHNDNALSIYLKTGFGNDQRHLLSKWLR